MKKRAYVLMLALCMVLSVTACGKKQTAKKAENKSETKTETKSETKTETVKNDEASGDFTYADLKTISFEFSSGVGAWGSSVDIKEDGSFEGGYHDSDMGDTGDDYPNGIVYVSGCTGQLDKLEKVDDLTYKTKVLKIDYDRTPGESEIEDGVKYEYTDFYGLEEGCTVYFYLAGSKFSDLPEDYISWIETKMAYDDSVTELPVVGMYNETSKLGFTGYDELQSYWDSYDRCLESAKEYEDSIENDDLTQTEYNETAENLYNVWDNNINSLWSLLKRTMPQDEFETLKKEQREWVSQKETEMDKASSEYAGGSIAPMAYYMKGAQLTEKRVKELQEYL